MPKFTRRELLEDALIAATIAATSGPAFAAQQQPAPAPSGRRIGPNDVIRIAVIGCNYPNGRGRAHLGSYLGMNDVQVVAVCDVDEKNFAPAVKMCTDKGKREPKTVQDLRRIIEDPEIDAVSIATPNHWHSLAGIWAMQAGKDVYVEKPVSHNVREGRVLADTAKKYSRICQAGTQIRSNPGSIEAIEYVRSGKIGKVSVARGLCYKPRPSIGTKPPGEIPATLDYGLWIGPAEMVPYHENHLHYNWHWQWNTGNGDLGNQGIHQMDVARWGLGKSGFPKTVVGFGGRLGYDDDGETPNTEVSVMDYGDSQLIFEVRGLPTKDYRGAKIGNVFHGSDGYVVLTGYDAGAAFDNDGKMVTTFKGGGDHFRNFIDCMRSRKTEDQRGPIEEGHVSSALCHLGNISYRVGDLAPLNSTPDSLQDNAEAMETFERFRAHLAENKVDPSNTMYHLGRKLEINVAKENFKDHEANQYLTRRYRKGFEVPKKA